MSTDHILLLTHTQLVFGALKAIIDIDGNNWSARFHTLLCGNSVIIKIQPDFIEEYYSELIPGWHYMPANLDNLTTVVEYVLDESNDREMHNVVRNANEWCLRSMDKEVFGRRALDSVERYRDALMRHDVDWDGDLFNKYDDWIECSV